MGSFEDVVYRGGGRRPDQSSCFRGKFRTRVFSNSHVDRLGFSAHFENWQTAPYPTVRIYELNGSGVEMRATGSRDGEQVQYRTPGGYQPYDADEMIVSTDVGLVSLAFLNRVTPREYLADHEQLQRLFDMIHAQTKFAPRPFAGSPTRTRPRRTYDPTALTYDTEGDYVPSYLANLSRRNADDWQPLKNQLEEFGYQSELFDEIRVRSFGRTDGDPFQIQVRKHTGPKSRRRKGSWRNLIDVGYGVSQALPLLTELLRPDAPVMLLLQQPEVHLHPQAQAALATLFCQVSAGGRQLVVETHSDYVIDRVRMDVRDGTTGLKPEDVSILYFEPGDPAVKIHSIRIDGAGNVLDAPMSYGDFFMEEVNRSIGLRKG